MRRSAVAVLVLTAVVLAASGVLPAVHAAATAPRVLSAATEQPEPGGPDEPKAPPEGERREESTGGGGGGQGGGAIETPPTVATEPPTAGPPGTVTPPATRTPPATETSQPSTSTTSPQLPGFETTLPFTGGNPLGFLYMGLAMVVLGSALLAWGPIARRIGRQGVTR